MCHDRVPALDKPERKVYYTHINRGVIDSNRKNGTNDPPIKFQEGKYGKPVYAHSVVLRGPCRVVYSNDGKLLPCGARLVILSEEAPEVDDEGRMET